MKTITLLLATLTLACSGSPLVEQVPGDPINATIVLSQEPATSGKIIVLPNSRGDWMPITTQEARDVVKAMEILDNAAQPRSESMGFMSSYSTDLVYRPNGFSAGEKAAMAREEAAFYEAKAKAEAEEFERVKWARSILEAWKKKVEGAK